MHSVGHYIAVTLSLCRNQIEMKNIGRYDIFLTVFFIRSKMVINLPTREKFLEDIVLADKLTVTLR